MEINFGYIFSGISINKLMEKYIRIQCGSLRRTGEIVVVFTGEIVVVFNLITLKG